MNRYHLPVHVSGITDHDQANQYVSETVPSMQWKNYFNGRLRGEGLSLMVQETGFEFLGPGDAQLTIRTSSPATEEESALLAQSAKELLPFLQSRMAAQSFVNGNVSLSVPESEGFEKEPVDLTLTEEDLKSLEAGTAMEL